MSGKLIACPFCGSGNIRLEDRDYPNYQIAATCRNCGSGGPIRFWVSDAAESWNVRTKPNKVKTVRITKEHELGILCRRLANLYKKPGDVYPPACTCVGLECGRAYCQIWWRMLLGLDGKKIEDMVQLWLFATNLD